MIPYSDPTLFYGEAVNKDLLITDGTVTVSGTSYSVAGATVTITNDLLEQEGFELHQSLCSESQITFGACESNYITFVMHENIPTVKGKTLSVYLIPDSDASKMLQIGVFKVQEDKLSADRTKRTVTAYDAMYDILNADVAGWYNSLLPNSTSSVTVGQMRFALTAYFGITQEAIVLANDSMVVKRTIEPESLSGADVIKALCEINGCFGQITNEGKFRYVELSPGIDDGLFPSDTLYPADDLYPQDVNHDVTMMPKAHYISVQFEDYNSEEITQLTIRTDDSDVGTTVGTAGNPYIIQGNFLVFGKNATELTTIASNCLDKIKNRYYKPCTVEAAGNPLHEVGDPIRVNTTYRGIVTYILQRTMRGIQALRDTYTAMGEEYTNQQLNSVSSQFKQLANKVTQVKIDTDGVQAYVEEQLDTSVQGSYANITAGQIALKVSKNNLVSDLDDEMSGITIESNAIKVQSSGTFTVDSSNFRLAQNGALTVRTVTFDHSGTGHSDITIDNGVLSSGGLQVGNGALQIASSGSFTYVTDSTVQINGAILSCPSGSQLLVNGDPILTQSSSLTISSNLTVGNIFGACTYITENSISVGGFMAGATYISSQGGGIDTPALTTGSFKMGLYNGQWQSITIGGTSYMVMVGN